MAVQARAAEQERCNAASAAGKPEAPPPDKYAEFTNSVPRKDVLPR